MSTSKRMSSLYYSERSTSPLAHRILECDKHQWVDPNSSPTQRTHQFSAEFPEFSWHHAALQVHVAPSPMTEAAITEVSSLFREHRVSSNVVTIPRDCFLLGRIWSPKLHGESPTRPDANPMEPMLLHVCGPRARAPEPKQRSRTERLIEASLNFS